MFFVPRSVKHLKDGTDGDFGPEAVALQSLRTLPAWVLLGEPGAGKSSAFKEEARATNGLFLSVAEFVYGDIEDEWHHRCLFLDGLDEIRASGASLPILYQLRSRLRKLGFPNFRIACRAADWFGQSDQADLAGASPDGSLRLYTLEPLSLVDVKQILKARYPGVDADEFIAQAETHDIGALLSNPQTLDLTVKALRGSSWPNSREETYQLACEALVEEENRQHRKRARFQAVPKTDLLDAAGSLFAALLLSGRTGIANDKSAHNECFPTLEALGLPSLSPVLRTPLFLQSSTADERLEPIHRSVAEYLAARWLGKQIDRHGLPLQRVLNLMLGFDGKAAGSLRGLYGWLALKSHNARPWLIKNDPLTVAFHGDLQAMGPASKQQLLKDIEREIQDNPAVFWAPGGAENLATLFHPDLRNDCLAALQNPRRDDASQTYMVFILKVLKSVAAQAHLTAELRNAAADGSRWERVRGQALEAWLSCGVSAGDAIEFLNQVNQGLIPDPDEEITGALLKALFPVSLTAVESLRYLHGPKSTTSGMYAYFWAYIFPINIREEDLPEVLRLLARRGDLKSPDWREFHLSRMLASLVVRAVQVHGDRISDDELFDWLRLGTDEYGERRHEPEFHAAITQWLAERPDRYKGLLGLCFKRNEEHPSPLYSSLFNDSQVLRGVPAPADIGLWHFQQIDLTRNEMLAREHLEGAVRSLWRGHSDETLTLDAVLDWAGSDPVRMQWLEPLLICTAATEGRIKQNQAAQERKRQHNELIRQRSEHLAKAIHQIRGGTASPALMGELAGVWLNRYSDTRGDTPQDRFRMYCNNHEEVYAAAREGMLACLKRDDLPSVREIIDLHVQQQAHVIRSACLLGMALLWEERAHDVDTLDRATLAKMVCFRLTDGWDAASGWFMHLVIHQADLVAEVLTACFSACFKAKKEYVDGIGALERDARYAQLARRSVPALLESFPTRNKSAQLNQLAGLLRAALKYQMPGLADIVSRKLKLKTLDAGQRVYFLLAGALIDPATHENHLWDVVGRSWQRVQHIADFLGGCSSDLSIDLNLRAGTFGKLIEILTPFAQVEWPLGGGRVSQAMHLGDRVRGLIGKLTALASPESLDEINRLLALPSLEKIGRHLRSGKHELIQKLRENHFSHPTLEDVAKILGNQSPVSPADLQAIVMDHLDQIGSEIKTSNKDLFRQFWTEGTENLHKGENSCRDALLAMLSARLEPLGIECQPEADYTNDKRADIRVSYRNRYALPIEIKGEWHPRLWTSIQNQLIPQYTKPEETKGYGVYLVLWVGGQEQPAAQDGGKKALTPQELELRLRNHLPLEAKTLIAVKTLDISWPQ